MNDFLSKIENFLFDILGLVLPGVILLLILISPVSFFDSYNIDVKVLSNSFILSGVVTFSKILKDYWNANLNVTLSILIITAYLLGHTIKVCSITFYDLMTALFDRTFNKLVVWFVNFIRYSLNWACIAILDKRFHETWFAAKSKILLNPIFNLINKVFTFTSPNYFADNDQLKTDCVTTINTRLGTSYPNVWYSVYKLSTVVQQQEGIRSLSGNFLAKYNLYRSLSFIFIFTTFYYYAFFQAAAKFISPELTKITSLLIYTSIILWFTFHYKYKRYWTLCGNETLVSLYYFLNKKKINEI